MSVSEEQRLHIESNTTGKFYVDGAAGTGKTTVAVARLLRLLESGVPANKILVFVPQPVLATPYQKALRSAELPPGGQVDITTIGGLARQMVSLFWQTVAANAGFASPKQPPTFLSLETAQYVMAHLIAPLLDFEGYFESVTIDRNRLYSQLIDNLNKAALNEFSHTDIGERLKTALLKETAQARMFDEVQDCVNRFRAYCLEHNLLDFSLSVDVFMRYLWTAPTCRGYLLDKYTHLIADNIEEDTPATHHLLRNWLPKCESALLVCDTDAGYRSFLGADPDSAEKLAAACDETVTFDESYVTSPAMRAFGGALGQVLNPTPNPLPASGEGAEAHDPRDAFEYEDHRFYPQMVDWVADEIAHLVSDDGIAPGQIVVLAPFLSDALRFSLMNRLSSAGVPARSHRPSRALREEPAARCLLTLAQLAHPEWGLTPTTYDVAYALIQAIAGIDTKGIDLVRAQLLAQEAYPFLGSRSRLAPFDALPGEIQERVTFVLGERYEALRGWLEAYIVKREQPVEQPPMPEPEAEEKPKKGRGKKKAKEPDPTPDPSPQAERGENTELDHFFALVFGEVLAQYGFGFHDNFDAADVAGNLVDSARNFRQTMTSAGILDAGAAVGKEYVTMVGAGLIADQYVRQWNVSGDDAVLIAPAYTFLMNNQPVEVQFWLDIGNRGWFERLYQPLTNPFVLSRRWNGGAWTDHDEIGVRRRALYTVTLGLIRRCRRKIYLGLSELGESGYESQGELLQAINRMLRRLAAAGN